MEVIVYILINILVILALTNVAAIQPTPYKAIKQP